MAIETGNQYRDRGWNRIKGEYKLLDGGVTLIGLFSESLDDDGQFVANYAAANEFGTRNGRIPERPWIRNWIDKNKSKIKTFVDKRYKEIIDGKIDSKKALQQIGEFIEGGLKDSITNLKTPPNALSTIKAKGSSSPLIDTGRMRNSVTHKEYFGRKGKKEMARAK